MDFISKTYAAVNISAEWQLSPEKGGFKSLGDLVSFLLPKFLILGGIIFFIMVIMAGFAILAGAGSEDAAAKTKWHQILTSALIGLIIMFVAYWVLQIINFVTGGALKGLVG